MNPLIDVSKLSDEEIMERLVKAKTYRNQQSALGHDPVVENIDSIIETLQFELQLRSRVEKPKRIIDRKGRSREEPVVNPTGSIIELGKNDE